MYSPDHPQIAVRHFELIQEAIIHNQPEMAYSRLKAIDYISGENTEGFKDFLLLLKLNLKTVILSSRMKNSSETEQALLDNNFLLKEATDLYLIYVKAEGKQRV